MLRRPTWFQGWIALLVVVGVAGRIAFYVSPFGVPDADEAVGGLMAKHELHGQFISAFMWGQAYGGPLETWLAAPIVGLFGPSYLGLRIVPIVLSAIASVVVWRIGLRTMRPDAAAVAGALSWCFPSFLLFKSIHFHIFYASGLLLGASVILQALRLRERPTLRGTFVLGLLAGVGIWQSFQLVAIVPTVLVWLVVVRRDVLRFAPAAFAGGLVGLLPVLASNIRHDWWSHDLGHPGNDVGYLHRLSLFFTNTLPIALDLRAPVTLKWLVWTPLGVLLYVAVLGCFAWFCVARRRGGGFRGLGVLVAVVVVFPFVYAISPLTSIANHAGYVVVAMPVLVLLACAWASSRRQAMLVSAIALVIMAGSVTDIAVGYSQRPANEFLALGTHAPLPRSLAPLERRLNQLGIRRVYADYWVAFRLDFETNEHIIAADTRPEALRLDLAGHVVPDPTPGSYTSRHPQYAAIVARMPAPAWIIANGFDPPSDNYSAFPAEHYDKAQVGIFTIWYHGADSVGTGP